MAGVWEGWAPAFAGDTDESWRGYGLLQRAGDTDCYSGRCAGTPLRRGYW